MFLTHIHMSVFATLIRLAEACAGAPVAEEGGELNWLLLMPMFFIDAYKLVALCIKDLIAIYMHLANTSSNELQSFFLAVLLEVVIHPMQQLECSQRFYVCAQGGEMQCYGTVFDFIGDHPGLAEIMHV